ncbi:MAG: hypothetical protein M1813_007746 [Trichoglossum hirsutum]|nr:MAG: hypothetical protein M1813_007746 [Trichoglossum hirsutum]
MGNLASTYLDQGRFEQVETLQVQVLELRRKVLGKEHPATLVSMGSLVLTYSGQGRFEQAEALQVEALEMCKRVLGEGHPTTQIFLENYSFLKPKKQQSPNIEEKQSENTVLSTSTPPPRTAPPLSPQPPVRETSKRKRED